MLSKRVCVKEEWVNEVRRQRACFTLPHLLGLLDDCEEQEPRRFAEQDLKHGEEYGEAGGQPPVV
jgi:hypothetical protein